VSKVRGVASGPSLPSAAYSVSNRLASAFLCGLFHLALSVTSKTFEALVFVFACVAYWIFERDRTVDLVASLISRPKGKIVRLSAVGRRG
jgi:hypothetical protein